MGEKFNTNRLDGLRVVGDNAISDRFGARQATRYVWAVGCSSFGNGLTFPLAAVYLSSIAGVGIGGTAVYFSVLAAAKIGVSAILSVIRLRVNYAYISATGSALAMFGLVGISMTSSWLVLVLFAIVVGVGLGGLSATFTVVMASMVGEAGRREFFGRRYRAMNIGIGLGAALGSIGASVFPTRLPIMFFLNGLSYVPFGILMMIYAHSGKSAAAGGEPQVGRDLRQARRWGGIQSSVLAIGCVNLIAVAFGISQLEVSAPMISIRLLGIDPIVVGAMIAMNTAAVVLLYKPVVTLLHRFDEVTGVMIAGCLWAISYFVAASFSFANPLVASVGLLLFALVFGLGEIAFAFSYQPLLVRRAGPEGSAQAGALANLFANIGDVVGPIIGASLVGLGVAWQAWLALGTGCLTILIFCRRRDSVLECESTN